MDFPSAMALGEKAVGAFDFPGTYRQIALERALIIQVGQPITKISITGGNGSFAVFGHERGQGFQHGFDLIGFQPVLLRVRADLDDARRRLGLRIAGVLVGARDSAMKEVCTPLPPFRLLETL